MPGRNESMLGVRHEKVGAVWYHCEKRIRRVLRDAPGVGPHPGGEGSRKAVTRPVLY